MYMRLPEYAKELGVSYRTAWNWYKSGKLHNARQLPTGTIIVETPKEVLSTEEYVVTYARVSSRENRNNLATQSKRLQDFCAAKGWVVKRVVEECGSGLNDKRPKLIGLLKDDKVTCIVIEHKDRLTRFGFNYIKELWPGKLVVINEVTENEKDLIQDFVSLVTSFTARLYGTRRSKKVAEKIINELSK